MESNSAIVGGIVAGIVPFEPILEFVAVNPDDHRPTVRAGVRILTVVQC